MSSNSHPHPTWFSPKRRIASALVASVLLLGACADTDAGETANTDAVGVSDTSSSGATAEVSSEPGQAGGVFDESMVHEIALEVDPSEYEAVIAAYLETGDKEWLEASVTIDGVSYEEVGLRLKGNSSLRSVTSDSAPETLPWLIRFDKYVDGQNHEGYADLVVRSNTTTTALNEAVALDLLEAAGLATQQAVSTNISVNGSDSVLRLVIEHPDDVWMAQNFSADGALYKAESTGDYTYRGDDPDSYDEVFDQEAGKDNTDLTPLIEFLDFINNTDDETFEAELADHLDIEAFADYLAMMNLVDNFDDIDGPGNNSYLYYDIDTDTFTVVPWDLNLAFGVRNEDQGVGGAPGGVAGDVGQARPLPGAAEGGAVRPEGVAPTEGDAPVDGAARPEGVAPIDGAARPDGAGGPNGSNVLAERFHNTESFEALYQDALVQLRVDLFDSGVASDILSDRVALLGDSLVDDATLETESSSIASAVS